MHDNSLKNLKKFQPGQTGNPNGRPVGSRSAFSAAFITDMQASWAQHGPNVLAQVAKRDPSRYLGVCASLIPKDVSLSIEQRLPGGLSPSDLAIFQAIKAAIPDAGTREPDEVLSFVLDAIRAHGARTIEGSKMIEGSKAIEGE
jgi:hypothetical protein